MKTYSMYHVQREYSPVTLFKGKCIIGRTTAQGARFYILDCHSPPNILKKVAYVEDVERKPVRYSQERGATQTSNSKEIHLRQIVSYSDSDHKSPPDMLNQMQESVQNLDMEEQKLPFLLYRFAQKHKIPKTLHIPIWLK